MNAIIRNAVEVSVEVAGQKLPIYQHDQRYFIAGEVGKPYAIVVRNLTGRRIEVLESVDQQNVLEDEPASLSNRGMIVTTVWNNHGWRISDSVTRDFVFTDAAQSVAAQATGSVAGTGVIGVAVFKELRPIYEQHIAYSKGGSWSVESHVTPESMRSSDLATAGRIGTGIGDERVDHVGHTTFTRASSMPELVVSIQYRTMAWLRDHGILTPEYPDAFGDFTGYAKYK